MAIGSRAAFESDRSRDEVTAMVATATAGMGSLVILILDYERGWHDGRRSHRTDRIDNLDLDSDPSSH